jgi:hypothetical protein
MNFFCDSKGAVFHVDPEPIYRNSAGANELYFIGAFPSSAQVTVAYKLPNGLYTKPKLMTNVTDSTLEITDQYGKGFSVWKEVIGQSVTTDDAGNIVYGQDYTVTENYGKVDVQFVIYANGQGATRLGTASSSFEIGKGVPIILPDSVENDILSQIVASLQTILQGVTQNTADIDILQEKTETNGNDIEDLKGIVKSNREDININRERIATNEIDISKNTDDILKNTTHIALLTDVQLQSGLQYVQPIEDEYSERITANGESVLDWQGNGSTARLLRVAGDTQATKNIFNFEKVSFDDNLKNGTMVFEKAGNSLVFKSIKADNNYFYTGTSDAGDLSAFLLKPNTTYTSFVTITVATLDDNDYNLIGAGSYSCCLSLQDVSTYATNRINIVDSYNQEKPYDKVGTFTVRTVFTTPQDLSAYTYVSTRVGNNIQVTYTNLMIVEGEYTEETMPKYVQGFDGLKNVVFQGIISKSADGTKESVLSFPAPIECGLGVTIDFENQKIINQGVEIPFTEEQKAVGNEYTVWRDGTEEILNENAIYGILPELTQEYVVVAEMGDISQDAVNNQINEALKGEY